MGISRLEGRPGSSGIGVGLTLRVQVAEARAPGGPLPDSAADPAAEETRLRAALETAVGQLDALARSTAERVGEDVGAIFEAQALFARDPGLIDPTLAAVAAGEPAAAAFDRVAAEKADALAGVDDEYFRERAADVRDVARRVVGILSGRDEPELHRPDGEAAVIVADDLDPSAVAALRPGLVAGLALAGGAPTGHAAIVARALGIPLVLGLGAALAGIADGQPAAVDGTAGCLLLAGDKAELAALVQDLAAQTESAPPDRGSASEAAALPVAIEANVGSAREAEQAAAAGAEGIGLVRTELMFLGRATAPGVEEQRAAYARIAATMTGRQVVFRTLDIGGDKPATYVPGEPELNPALGVRGIRLGLRRPDLFESQLDALIAALADADLSILVPMVTAVEEVQAAREVIERRIQAARARGARTPATVRVGIMVEIPSAAVMADAFAPIVDFFSIGTNDLVQYALAADRTNPALADLATPLQPAILRLIERVTAAAAERGRPVAVCGEAAADPLVAPLLVGLGVTELSVAPASIPRLRAALAGIDLAACRTAAEAALRATSLVQVRAIAEDLAARRRSP